MHDLRALPNEAEDLHRFLRPAVGAELAYLVGDKVYQVLRIKVQIMQSLSLDDALHHPRLSQPFNPHKNSELALALGDVRDDDF